MDAQNPPPSANELQQRLQALTEENLQLRDKTEHLFSKVGYLESRLGHLASSNTDLSCRLIQSEENRLKISKELVEEKLQMNKMTENFEEETFVLKNKMLNQDGVIVELQMEQNKLLSKLQSPETCMKVGEKSGLDLTEENVSLKKDYQALAEAHDKELASNKELRAELLALGRAQDALRRQLEEQQRGVKTTTQGLRHELERVRPLISRMPQSRVKVRQRLLGNQDGINQMLVKMKTSYEEQQEKLEEKVLMCSKNRMKEVEEENSMLQLQVKQLNEEYRLTLVCYLHDLTEYIDALGEGERPPETSKLRSFVHGMLQDVCSSYRVREEQLAAAACSYKRRLQKVTKTHHALITAYRVQREQILAKPESRLDPGPPEAQFSLEPVELRGETEREAQRPCRDQAGLEGGLQAAWEQVGFEKERALLITRATVAEAQVLELQDYVDNHLCRYKEELLRLRRLQGTQEAGCSQSADASLRLEN